MSFINFNSVDKKYNDSLALDNINISIEKNEQCVINGPSGSGKSTFLYLLGGLDFPTSGEVSVDGISLSKFNDKDLANYRNECVGFIFQFHFLLPSMNCLNNILLPSKISGKNFRNIKEHIHQLAEKIDVTHCLNKYPYQLSGGEQQRINLIRALSLKPKLLLCDEPTGNLDSKNSSVVVQLLRESAKEFSATLIMVTHNEKLSHEFPRKVVIKDGQLKG